MKVVLASASPRRVELLRAAGIDVDVSPVDVDESLLPDEEPPAFVERVARLKAAAGAARHPGRLVVGADTAVVLDGEIFGKPADRADAVRMLTRLAGRVHEVLTGVAVVGPGVETSFAERTRVWMSPIPVAAIEACVDSGEPMDKAGAYGIQGLASRFIPRIEGSYANVVGLPVAQLSDLLDRIDARQPGG